MNTLTKRNLLLVLAGGVAAGLVVGVDAQPAVEWVFALVVVALVVWLTAIALGVPVGRRAGR